MMSMLMSTAEVLRMAPAKKNMPPISMVTGNNVDDLIHENQCKKNAKPVIGVQ